MIVVAVQPVFVGILVECPESAVYPPPLYQYRIEVAGTHCHDNKQQDCLQHHTHWNIAIHTIE